MNYDFQWVAIGIGGIFGALLVVLYLVTGRITPETPQEFWMGWRARKRVKPWIILVSYAATLYSAFTVVGIPGVIHTHGVGGFGFIVFAEFFQILLVFAFGRALWKRAGSERFSPIEVVSDVYGSKALGLLVLFATVLFVVPHIATQLVGMGRLLRSATGGSVEYVEGVGFILLVMFIYAELGGFRAIVATDVVQFVLIVVGMFGLVGLYFGLQGIGAFDLLRSLREGGQDEWLGTPGPNGFYTWQVLLSQFLFIGLWPIAHPSISVKLMAQRDERAFTWLIVGMGILPLIMFLPDLFIGLAGAQFFPGLESGDAVTGVVLQTVAAAGPWFAALGFIFILGVLSAAMSTADSQVLAVGQIVTRDLLVPYGNPKMTAKSQIGWSRIVMGGVLVIAYLVGMRPPTFVVDLSLLSGMGTGVLVPTYLGILQERPSRLAAWMSLVGGLSALALGRTIIPQGVLFGFDNGVVAIGIATLLYLVGSAMSGASDS